MRVDLLIVYNNFLSLEPSGTSYSTRVRVFVVMDPRGYIVLCSCRSEQTLAVAALGTSPAS